MKVAREDYIALSDYTAGSVSISIERNLADWFKFEGSSDGRCPWDKWRLVDINADAIYIVGQEIVLRFELVSTPHLRRTLPAPPVQEIEVPLSTFSS